MLTAINKIYDKLSNDETLVDMLASNRPFNNKNDALAKVNSILPAGMAGGITLCPFITIQDGVASKIGETLKDETFYIRVYNDPQKSYVEINSIGERIIELLDLASIELDSGVHVKTRYESALQAATDQSLNKNFRELRFRMFVL